MKKSKVAVAVASAIGATGAAQAADIAVTLTDVVTGSNNGASAAFTLEGQLSGTYNTSTGVVSMAAGTTSATFNTSPTTTLFTHNNTNWSTGDGNYSASAYSCAEGTFGGGVGAHLCGNYSLGTNFLNESTINYNSVPGTRTLGGDDTSVGSLQQGSDYATTTFSYAGGTLIMNSAAWTGGSATSTAGLQLRFSAAAIPVPAAVWLFGSALGLLGWVRRRATA